MKYIIDIIYIEKDKLYIKSKLSIKFAKECNTTGKTMESVVI